MPFYSRLFIKTALIYAVLAALGWVLEDASALMGWQDWNVYATAVHFYLVGWVLQLIMGVVYWMFPTYTRTRPRGYDRLMLTAYVTLNVGLVLRGLVEPFPGIWSKGWSPYLLLASGVLQWLGIAAFVFNTSLRLKVK